MLEPKLFGVEALVKSLVVVRRCEGCKDCTVDERGGYLPTSMVESCVVITNKVLLAKANRHPRSSLLSPSRLLTPRY